MAITRDPDEVKVYRPTECEGCPLSGKCSYTCMGTHDTYDLEVTTKLVAHKAYACNCPLAQIRQDLPAELNSYE